ncbi:MAG: hypothetical protein LBP42_08080 [Treponema sp.]|jgi:hypothetical protein|nr:hypothetical protein [Treponema sp.]
MPNILNGPVYYLEKFGGQSVACTQYALAKLGVERSHCFLKIDEYVILCVPFQFGFKRSLFLASLSQQELTFFRRYVNGIIGLSITFSPDRRQKPIKFFIRCTLTTVGQMKDRENVGLFAVDYKSTPNDLINMLGSFLDHQDRLRGLYEEYGDTPIKMTSAAAKEIGYNMFATIMSPNREGRRIQIFSLSTKFIEHLEAADAPERPSGASVAYQIYFKKFRVSVAGTIQQTSVLPQGLVRTVSTLAISPELVEIIDDYWYHVHSNPNLKMQIVQ